MKYFNVLPILLCLIFTSCGAQRSDSSTDQTNKVIDETIGKVVKTDDEWKAILTPLEYKVLRHDGTERPFTGDLLKNKESGEYICRGCALPLFSSSSKFDSGTGWPSYYEPIRKSHLNEHSDNKFGWNRVEVRCVRCDGHLGHVFNDGPDPTGLRYCINSVSLDFLPAEEDKN